MMNHKLDSEGNYLPFHGITVVHYLKEASLALLANIEPFLRQSPILSKYYAPLPLSSYHMTLYDVETARGMTLEEWQRHVQQEEQDHYTWSKLQSICQDAAAVSERGDEFAPKVTLTQVDYYNDNVMVLLLALNREDLERAKSIRQQLSQAMDRFETSYTFHLTLAYAKKPIPLEEKFAVQKEVARLITTCFGGNGGNEQQQQEEEKNGDADDAKAVVVLSLGPPRLCTFRDMTAFPEWTEPSEVWPYDSL